MLEAAKWIISDPGYQACQGAIDAYEAVVQTARQTGQGAINWAYQSLHNTESAWNSIIAAAQATASNVLHGVEWLALDAAGNALAAYSAAEGAVLAGLQDAIDRVGVTAEAAAFGAANGALALAQANTKDLQLAKDAVDLAGKSGKGFLDAGNWIVSRGVNILNIKTVTLDGDLRALIEAGKELNAHVVGTFAEQNVDFNIPFTPGKGEEMTQRLFHRVMDDTDHGALKVFS